MDELPYDFIRKRLSILFENGDCRVVITKGALRQVLQVCSSVELADGSRAELSAFRSQIEDEWRKLSAQGCRVLGLAFRDGDRAITRIDRETENGMVFLGFIVLSDPPKKGIESTLDELKKLGIRLKIVTGDNALIAAHLAHQVGLDGDQVLSGSQIEKMSDAALMIGRSMRSSESWRASSIIGSNKADSWPPKPASSPPLGRHFWPMTSG